MSNLLWNEKKKKKENKMKTEKKTKRKKSYRTMKMEKKRKKSNLNIVERSIWKRKEKERKNEHFFLIDST